MEHQEDLMYNNTDHVALHQEDLMYNNTDHVALHHNISDVCQEPTEHEEYLLSLTGFILQGILQPTICITGIHCNMFT